MHTKSILYLTLVALFFVCCKSQILVLNEWLANSGVDEDWIEIYNPRNTSNAYPIGTFYLSDDPDSVTFAQKYKYKIPAGQIVPSLGYWYINQLNGFKQPFFGEAPSQQPGSLGFGLSSFGETFAILDNTGFSIDRKSYDGSHIGQTFGRWTVSTGAVKYPLLSRPTKGTANAYPYVGPVVITEIMALPPRNSPPFVAIYNRGDTAISLRHPTFPTPWRIKGIDFDFPLTAVINPKQTAFICPQNVSEANFTRAWNSTKIAGLATAPLIFCNWKGNLTTREQLEVCSVFQTPNGTAYVVEDSVTYNVSGTTAQNPSVMRVSLVSYGEEPKNWIISTNPTQNCTQDSDCQAVDRCTVATCDTTSKTCTYSFSTVPPICVAPQEISTTTGTTTGPTTGPTTTGTPVTTPSPTPKSNGTETPTPTPEPSGINQIVAGLALFLWIIIGVGALLVIVAIIVVVYCCCIKGQDDDYYQMK